MKQKRALVCGASQGIGCATAQRLAQMGMSVTLLSRSEEKLKESVNQLEGEGHDFISADIGDFANWKDALQKKHQENPYSVVILNSAGPKSGPITQAQPEMFITGMTNHLVANSTMVGLFLDEMKRQNFGRIIAITSTSVKIPIPNLGVSNTVRAAVAAWAKTLSLEVASFGITVNNVMPGYTETPRLQELIQNSANSAKMSYAEMETQWKNQVPMKRFAQPEETAELIAFLTSDKAAYITGQNIAVDGGRLGCL